MITFNFKNFIMSGLVVVFLASINVAQAEDAFTAQGKIPPAPLGPYISTGLLDSETETPDAEAPPVEESPVQNSTAVTPVSGGDKKTFVSKPTAQIESNKVPLEAFSPDIPWPADMRPSGSPSSARWMPNQMMPDSNRRQISSETRQQQSIPQQYGPAYYRAPVPNKSAYSRRLAAPQMNNQQMPNSYIPQNNFSSGYPAGNMPNPYYYQPGYTN